MLSNTVVVIVLSFYKLDTLDPWSWEDIGYRTGFISIAQLPLIVLLAGKDNIIGWLTGFGHERLNWLHRWTARTLWLSATLHLGFWFRTWARYDYIKQKLTTDPITQRGLAAWCILTFVVLTAMAPVRRINYEIFVISHLITFAGFIAAIWLHIPHEVKVWVWLPVGFFAFDRLLRAMRLLRLNLTPFQCRARKADGIWANSASFSPLRGGATRITINKPAFVWRPGQHVFLSCHSVVPLQSHPFTIASLASDEKLELLVKAQQGGTKAFLNHAIRNGDLPTTTQGDLADSRRVCIEGPYGRMRSLGQFDSVILFAGSTGATFTVPHMRHLVQSWQSTLSKGTLTRRIRFVWVIKSRDQLDWFQDQLDQVIEMTTSYRTSRRKDEKQVDMSIYVTCDEELVAEKSKTGNTCQAIANYITTGHHKAEEAASARSGETNATKVSTADNVEVISSDSNEETSSQAAGCGPDGSCCCKSTVEDESDAHVCTCSPNPKAPASTSPIEPIKAETWRQSVDLRNPPLKLLSGRPQPKTIIRKVLEEAEGESAVVVCGPQGLRDDVRASVVALSDERAVHKGTGAQGIYLHVEGFGY